MPLRPSNVNPLAGARPSTSGVVGLLLSSGEEEKLFSVAIQSQGLAAQAVRPDGRGLIAAVAAAVTGGKPAAVVADVSLLASDGLSSAMFAARLAQSLPHVRVFVRLPSRTGISRSERAWATRAGIASLLPGTSLATWRRSLAPVVERILTAFDVEAPDLRALESAVDRMGEGTQRAPSAVDEIHALAWQLERESVSGALAFEALCNEPGLVADRRYRGKIYPECFIAKEAIGILARRLAVSCKIAQAAATFLWRTGRIHHVLRDAAFDDGHFFFRIGGTARASNDVDLAQVQQAMRARDGVAIADRSYLGTTYPKCFAGSEAVDWLRMRYRLTLGEAEFVGQSLLELGELHHVLDEHQFVGEGYFYRFRMDELA